MPFLGLLLVYIVRLGEGLVKRLLTLFYKNYSFSKS
jgi:hypothetical protein